MITSAIASIAPMGLFPAGAVLIPLIPAGFSACQALLKSAFSLGIGGTPSITAQGVASAIAVLVPMVPPLGLSLLQTLLESAFRMGVAGTSSVTSQMIASAIITYYMTGGVI
jgi:hypothetical protein